MSKTNKLTLYIFIAMLVGILTGYLINAYSDKTTITYSPSKDYVGADSISLDIDGETVVQPIWVVKDSAAYRQVTDSFTANKITGTWVVVANTTKAYAHNWADVLKKKGNKSLRGIAKSPKHGLVNFSTIQSFSDNVKLLTTIFLRLVQMIIAPIVFCTLVVGIAKLGDLKTVGRVGGKAMLWFITASLISLGLGLVLVTFFEPGVGVDVSNVDKAAVSELVDKSKGFSLAKFVEHVVPKSVVEAMATNEILQLVVFSIFFGIALTALGEKGKGIIHTLDTLGHVMLKMVGYVMIVAPAGVFGAMASAIAKNGLGILTTFSKYVGEFYLGLLILWLLMLIVGYLILKRRLPHLLRRIASPMAIAFNTASSEAVYPKMVEEMERFGCKDKIVSFVLPLGYSFNLDGSMMYMTFASMFIAQAYGITSITGDVSQQIIMLLVFLVTSKGIAGVPRASLVVVLATGQMFGLPAEGVGLILAIDVFCDMGRTMTNVLGNALATAAVSKWEGELEHTDHHQHPHH